MPFVTQTHPPAFSICPGLCTKNYSTSVDASPFPIVIACQAFVIISLFWFFFIVAHVVPFLCSLCWLTCGASDPWFSVSYCLPLHHRPANIALLQTFSYNFDANPSSEKSFELIFITTLELALRSWSPKTLFILFWTLLLHLTSILTFRTWF